MDGRAHAVRGAGRLGDAEGRARGLRPSGARRRRPGAAEFALTRGAAGEPRDPRLGIAGIPESAAGIAFATVQWANASRDEWPAFEATATRRAEPVEALEALLGEGLLAADSAAAAAWCNELVAGLPRSAVGLLVADGNRTRVAVATQLAEACGLWLWREGGHWRAQPKRARARDGALDGILSFRRSARAAVIEAVAVAWAGGEVEVGATSSARRNRAELPEIPNGAQARRTASIRWAELRAQRARADGDDGLLLWTVGDRVAHDGVDWRVIGLPRRTGDGTVSLELAEYSAFPAIATSGRGALAAAAAYGPGGGGAQLGERESAAAGNVTALAVRLVGGQLSVAQQAGGGSPTHLIVAVYENGDGEPPLREYTVDWDLAAWSVAWVAPVSPDIPGIVQSWNLGADHDGNPDNRRWSGDAIPDVQFDDAFKARASDVRYPTSIEVKGGPGRIVLRIDTTPVLVGRALNQDLNDEFEQNWEITFAYAGDSWTFAHDEFSETNAPPAEPYVWTPVAQSTVDRVAAMVAAIPRATAGATVTIQARAALPARDVDPTKARARAVDDAGLGPWTDYVDIATA